jgi:signal transduction histidine kinase
MDRPRIYVPPEATNEPSAAAQPASDAAIRHLSADRIRPTWVDVRALVDELCAQFAERAKAARVETTVDVPARFGMLADPDMLRLALTNLYVNALEAMPAGGRLVITSYAGSGGVELEVADSGPGLSDDALGRAFDLFYTTKRGAAGLGLSKVRRVAAAHGGDVVAANCPEGGAAFTLRFPAPSQRQSAA